MSAGWRGVGLLLLVAAATGGCPGRDGGDDAAETDPPESDDAESDTPDSDTPSDTDGVDTDADDDTDPPAVDLDSDGWTADLDCDDEDGAISPDAQEVCDGQDNDCSGTGDDAAGLCPQSGLDCVESTCQGVAGCVEAIVDDACVIDETCFAAGDPNPENPCEVCDPDTSPTSWSVRVAEACDDGEPCTTGETCDAAGQCVGGGPTDCSTFGEPPCAEGVCVDGVGCTIVPQDGATCDDGRPCTVNDTCDNGLCVSGGAPDCSSFADDCNAGTCDPGTGACQAVATRLGSACDDGDACTTGTTCAIGTGGEGACVGGVSQGDAFEANDTVATARVLRDIDDCGDTSIDIDATVNPSNDVDWFRFSVNNVASFCAYTTRVALVVPAARDYDLLVCVSQASSFSASCDAGDAVTPPTGLTGYQCCVSDLGPGAAETVQVDWGCSGTFCTDDTGTVFVRVTPAGASQTPECGVGYGLTASED